MEPMQGLVRHLLESYTVVGCAVMKQPMAICCHGANDPKCISFRHSRVEIEHGHRFKEEGSGINSPTPDIIIKKFLLSKHGKVFGKTRTIRIITGKGSANIGL